MKLISVLVLLLSFLFNACTSGPVVKSRIEETVSAYAAAIRWSEFEKAQEFQPAGKRARLDLAWLKNIHVSTYEVLYKKEPEGGLLEDGRVLEQTVRIRYFIEPYGVEKEITDHQIWRFNEDRWKMELITDLPEFK